MRYRFLVFSIAILGVFLFVGGCGGNDEDASRGNASPQNARINTGPLGVDPTWIKAGDIIEGRGRIAFLFFEGGFHGIVATDGSSYDPVNLDPGFHIDGLAVKFTLRALEDQDSYHMWGLLVEVISIEKVYTPDR